MSYCKKCRHYLPPGERFCVLCGTTQRSLMRFLYAVTLALALAGCPPLNYEPAPCTPYETRCRGQVAEICAPSGGWRPNLDCRTVAPTTTVWRCCANGRGRHTCLTEERCLSREP